MRKLTALLVALVLVMGFTGAAFGATSWGPSNHYNISEVSVGTGSSPAVIDCASGYRVLIQYQGFGYGPLDSTGNLSLSVIPVSGSSNQISRTWTNTELDGTTRKWVTSYNYVYLLRFDPSQAWSGGDATLWAACTTQAAGTYPVSG